MLDDVRQRAQQLLQDNSTTILTAGGVVGTVVTAVLTGRATIKAAAICVDMEVEREVPLPQRGEGETGFVKVDPTTFDVIKKVWPLYIPPVLAGGATIGSIIMAHRMSASKAAALAAAYGVSQNHLQEYKAKVEEKFGIKKAETVRDEVQQDRVNENPPKNSQVVVIGAGEVLFYDAWSGRYFKSSVEAIRRAENAVNREIFQSNEAPLKSFYDELDLPRVTMDEHLGWNIANSMEVEISAVLTPEHEPCLAIEFVNLPIVDFRSRY